MWVRILKALITYIPGRGMALFKPGGGIEILIIILKAYGRVV